MPINENGIISVSASGMLSIVVDSKGVVVYGVGWNISLCSHIFLFSTHLLSPILTSLSKFWVKLKFNMLRICYMLNSFTLINFFKVNSGFKLFIMFYCLNCKFSYE